MNKYSTQDLQAMAREVLRAGSNDPRCLLLISRLRMVFPHMQPMDIRFNIAMMAQGFPV